MIERSGGDAMTGPAQDVSYRSRTWPAFLTAVVTMFVLLLTVQVVIRLAQGDPLDVGLVLGAAMFVVPLALIFVLVGAGRGWQIRTTGEAIEFTPPRQGSLQPLPKRIVLRWEEIASARLRYRGPWRSVVVQPKKGAAVTVRTAFLAPGQSALMADLARRGVAVSTPGAPS